MFIYYPKVSENEISFLEEKLNFSFSNSYKSFLKSYGGLFIDYPSYSSFNVNFLDDSLIDILKIFTPLELIEINQDCLSEIKEFLDCIIISGDAGGNFFLLDKYGRIYYWDRTLIHLQISCYERKVLTSDENNNQEEIAIYFLFHDFTDFFNIIEKSSKEQKSPFLSKDNLQTNYLK